MMTKSGRSRFGAKLAKLLSLDLIEDRQSFFKILVRLCALTFIPMLAINLVLSITIFADTKKRVLAENASALAMLSAAADERLKNAQNIIGVLGKNDDVRSFLSVPTLREYERNQRILDLLNDFVTSNEAVSSIYLYSNVGDLIVASNGGVYRSALFYDTVWKSDLDRGVRETQRTTVRSVADENGKSLDVVSLYCGLPLGAYVRTGGIVINVKESKLLMRPVAGAGSDAYAVDGHGVIITHPDRSRIGAQLGDRELIDAMASQKAGSLSRRDAGGFEAVAFRREEAGEWTYVSAVDLTDFVAAVWRNLLMDIALLVCAAAAMILVGLRFSRSFYVPFEELSRSNRLFEKARPLMVGNLVSAIAHYRLSDESEIADALRIVGVELPRSRFAALLFEVDDYAGLAEKWDRPALAFMRRTLADAVRSSVDGADLGLLGDSETDRLCLVLNYDSRAEDVPLETAERAVARAARELPFTLTCGVGGSYPSVADVHRSYAEASYALGEKLIFGGGRTISFAELNAEAPAPIRLAPDAERELLAALRLGRTSDIDSLLDALLEDVRVHRRRDTAAVRRYFEKLANALADAAAALDCPLEGDLAAELAKLETIEAIGARLGRCCGLLARRVNERRASALSGAADRIAAYVDANFARQDISLVDIGEAVDLSPCYVSRIFKERFGSNYVDYLNVRRVERAKVLLREDGMTIAKARELTGFSNMQTFTRVFKKLAGTTPGAYRDFRAGEQKKEAAPVGSGSGTA